METASGAVPLVTYLRPSETRDVAEAALLAARRPWEVVAQCANLLGVLAAVEAGIGITALGRNFVPSGFAEIPPGVGLPPLGTLDHVIDRLPGCSDPPLAGGDDTGVTAPKPPWRLGQRPRNPRYASTGAHAAQPRPTTR
jgi:hypothetical protein